MIRRIELANFMSHARTVIEPADGLTVLVGPNNCGKSAVVTALQILCHNDNSTYVTRHNERECTVTLETDDGHIVEWCRKNNSPRYTVNGQLFDRLGRGSVPDGLHDVLRLAKVTAEGNQEFDVHFGEQKSPVFLLDKPGSHAAQFFASSSDAASLVEMQKRHQQKMVDARRERSQLEARAERLKTDLTALAATDQIGISIEQAEAQHEELGRLGSSVEQVTLDMQAMEQAIALLDHCQSEATALAPLIAPPVLVSSEPVALVIEQLTRTRLGVEQQSALAVSLSGLQTCPEITDERPIGALIRDLQSIGLASLRLDAECLAIHNLRLPPMMAEVEALREAIKLIGALTREVAMAERQIAALEPLATAPDMEIEVALANDVQAFTRVMEAVQRTEIVHKCLDALDAAPELADTVEIESTIRNLTGATTAFATHSRDHEGAEQALRDIERLLRTWAEQRQLCPTCGGTLDPSRLVAHAGACVGGRPHA